MDSMAKTIKAQLIQSAYCRAHWIITFSESGECINADLTGNTLHYTCDHFHGILDTIEFRIKDRYPPIDEQEGYMWLPDHLMQQHKFCRCVEWVSGVIWRYAELGCLEKISTDGIPADVIPDKLLERQSNALIGFGMRRLQIKADTVQGPSRGE
ncbi:hypothetical protein IFM53868_09334 [Aspergillus udagawae]|uniref:Uncharacterized protein n=1 Tax=Aspergillus udagawae TaxID=91492 RepID=A0ABQ1BC12_9EURO|nr:hypothetical protein IFM53868_09334 [Aspergillus udagawae]